MAGACSSKPVAKTTSQSSQTQIYGSGNAVDGNASTYRESANNAFPQWIHVDLGSTQTVARLVLKLPPPTAWATRSQTLTITDGTTGATIVASASYTFDPNTGNTVTMTFPATGIRNPRITFTANTGWPAGQVSELEVYAA